MSHLLELLARHGGRIGVALLLVLGAALSMCSTADAARVYGNLDPCIIVGSEKACLASATPEQVAAWDHYWLIEPHLGDDERAALKRYAAAQWADVGTTGAGLLICTAVVESNPLGWAALVGKAWHYAYLERKAAQTPRAYSMADGINDTAAFSVLPAAWNVGIIGSCI